MARKLPNYTTNTATDEVHLRTQKTKAKCVFSSFKIAHELYIFEHYIFKGLMYQPSQLKA